MRKLWILSLFYMTVCAVSLHSVAQSSDAPATNPRSIAVVEPESRIRVYAGGGSYFFAVTINASTSAVLTVSCKLASESKSAVLELSDRNRPGTFFATLAQGPNITEYIGVGRDTAPPPLPEDSRYSKEDAMTGQLVFVPSEEREDGRMIATITLVNVVFPTGVIKQLGPFKAIMGVPVPG